MSKAMQLVGIILLGIFTLAIIYLMSDVRSTNELDYYLLQEVTEASMYDAVDYSYYRETGLISVDRDMFLESFNRRFAESVENNRDYTIKIIDFNETPPKVSVEVSAPTVASVKGEAAIVTNRVNGIIESIYDDFVYSKGDYKANNYDDRSPEIKLISQNGSNYELEMSDNYGLRRYAIIKAENGDNFIDDVYNSVKESDWINIYPKEYATKKTITQSLANNQRGFWLVVEDLSGLWASMPITDIDPWFENIMIIQEEDKKGTAGNLRVTFKDDKGLTSYRVDSVQCSGTVSDENKCDSGWTTVNTGSTIPITDAVLTNDKRYTKTVYDIVINNAPYYRITLTDNGGHSSTIIVEGNKKVTVPIQKELYNDKDGYRLAFGNCDGCNYYAGNITVDNWNKEYNVDTNLYSQVIITFRQKDKWSALGTGSTTAPNDYFGIQIGNTDNKHVLSSWHRTTPDNPNGETEKFGGWIATNGGLDMTTDTIVATITLDNIKNNGNHTMKFYTDFGSFRPYLDIQIYSIVLK